MHWGAYTRNEAEKIPEVWAALLELLREGKLRPVIFKDVYRLVEFSVQQRGLSLIVCCCSGLEALPGGLKDLGSRKTWGKAVLQIKSDRAYSKL